MGFFFFFCLLNAPLLTRRTARHGVERAVRVGDGLQLIRDGYAHRNQQHVVNERGVAHHPQGERLERVEHGEVAVVVLFGDGVNHVHGVVPETARPAVGRPDGRVIVGDEQRRQHPGRGDRQPQEEEERGERQRHGPAAAQRVRVVAAVRERVELGQLQAAPQHVRVRDDVVQLEHGEHGAHDHHDVRHRCVEVVQAVVDAHQQHGQRRGHARHQARHRDLEHVHAEHLSRVRAQYLIEAGQFHQPRVDHYVLVVGQPHCRRGDVTLEKVTWNKNGTSSTTR